MKKILAFALAVMVVLSLFAFVGCSNGDEKVENAENVNSNIEGFESYVSDDSAILGTWKETSTSDEFEWTFFSSTTLHITETIGESSYSTVCAYNFNDETGELEYYVMTTKKTMNYTATIDGVNMELRSADGNDVRTFEKVS